MYSRVTKQTIITVAVSPASHERTFVCVHEKIGKKDLYASYRMLMYQIICYPELRRHD